MNPINLIIKNNPFDLAKEKPLTFNNEITSRSLLNDIILSKKYIITSNKTKNIYKNT